jgi:hypothetical protein
MANDEWTDGAADAAARAAARRETGGASVAAGGKHAPGEVTIPGRPEEEAVTPGRGARTDVAVPRSDPETEVPGRRTGDADEEERRFAPTPEEAPELLGERSDYPILYGEDPGDVR